jgi:hypothetical protein
MEDRWLRTAEDLRVWTMLVDRLIVTAGQHGSSRYEAPFLTSENSQFWLGQHNPPPHSAARFQLDTARSRSDEFLRMRPAPDRGL